MASGDIVGQIIRAVPPNTLYATVSGILGGSTPKETMLVYDFDASTQEYMDFVCYLHGYVGTTGLTITIMWSAKAAVNDCVWNIGIRALPDDAEDFDTTAHTYVYNAVTDTVPSAIGEVTYVDITFTDGVDMDSWADGEMGVVRVTRDATDGADTLTADASLWGISVKET